jgi:hypothetical protein
MGRSLLVVFFFHFVSIAHAENSNDVIDLVLACSVTKSYMDGAKINGSGVEIIKIENRKINFNKDDSKTPKFGAVSKVTIKSGANEISGNLLKKDQGQILVTFVNDFATEGGVEKKLFIFEIEVEKLKVRRTVMPLFAKKMNKAENSVGNCVTTEKSPQKNN